MKKNERGFTLIELIVVIAILGILVLLAAPKFLGYTKDTNDVLVENDIKTHEDMITSERVSNLEFDDNWEAIDSSDLSNLVSRGLLVSKKGPVSPESQLKGSHYIIPKDFTNSKLTGVFIADVGGQVYYVKDGMPEKEIVPDAPEEDFEWIADPDVGNDKNGYFAYIGKEKVVKIPKEIDGVKLESYFFMFYNTEVEKVISDNEDVTDFSYMFAIMDTEKLDLSEFTTKGANDMSGMFYNFKSSELNLSSFDTSNVEHMSHMFSNAKIDSLNLGSSFNTSKVKTMNEMFYLLNMESLDLGPNFDTSNVENMGMMFSGLSVENLNLGRKFNTSNVEIMYHMFSSTRLKSLNLGNLFDVSNVEDMTYMFYVSKIEHLDFGGKMKTPTANLSNMFSFSEIQTVDLSSFDFSKVNLGGTFTQFKFSTGYARSKEDAEMINKYISSYVNGENKFIVKP